ncbi:MAG: hypothetical protein ACD_20C00279G0009 [uncultured bacterium]|nr:MAG: hypothetical protein ACD_20C00279G0009 [uncultured bacterium]
MELDLTPYLFLSSILIVLCLVCLIQNKKIKDAELKVKELEEIISQYEHNAV